MMKSQLPPGIDVEAWCMSMRHYEEAIATEKGRAIDGLEPRAVRFHSHRNGIRCGSEQAWGPTCPVVVGGVPVATEASP